MHDNFHHFMKLSSIELDGTSGNFKIVVGWKYEAIHTVSGSQNLVWGDDGATANV